MQHSKNNFESLLLVSFGGPEKMADVIPFLENVLEGKNVPRKRLEEVAEHYRHFDGVSPINQQNRELIEALKKDFAEHGIELPIYWGNRNWSPFLTDAISEMKNDGIRNSLAFFTSAYSCYSGCRQYRENLAVAREKVGLGAPEIAKTRMFFNHPLFIEAIAARVDEAFDEIGERERERYHVLFTAHSIPQDMADQCQYVKQLTETSRLVADRIACKAWGLVFQSRSGPPHQPWLEPDVCDHLLHLKSQGIENVLLIPVGFLSDHLEVLFDLDVEAKEVCENNGMNLIRVKTVGTHPLFIQMIRELVLERIADHPRKVVGDLPCSHDVCPENCCLPGNRPTMAAARPE